MTFPSISSVLNVIRLKFVLTLKKLASMHQQNTRTNLSFNFILVYDPEFPTRDCSWLENRSSFLRIYQQYFCFFVASEYGGEGNSSSIQSGLGEKANCCAFCLEFSAVKVLLDPRQKHLYICNMIFIYFCVAEDPDSDAFYYLVLRAVDRSVSCNKKNNWNIHSFLLVFLFVLVSGYQYRYRTILCLAFKLLHTVQI